jgi:DNA-binding NarL/FixJ family response regulator
MDEVWQRTKRLRPLHPDCRTESAVAGQGECYKRTLKETTSTTNIPVLIISSLSEKNGEKLIQAGAAGYFAKGSMTPETLENAISGILKKRLLVPYA